MLNGEKLQACAINSFMIISAFDYNIVWDVAANKLPDLRKKLQVLLAQDLETPNIK